jgi:hypothetical protein
VSLLPIISLQNGINRRDFSETQYKYRFKQWGWKKNVSASKKRAVLDISQRRAQLGKATLVTYKGKQIDAKKLRREAKNVKRKEKSLTATVLEPGQQENLLFPSNFLLDGKM